jgi:4-phospho-D-threonate 3-dehydrogenase / 4-phospho-D-erythronate 3-dehydrogenase
VTTHIALEEVPKRLTPERLRRVIDLTHDALIGLGAPRARIAVAALNPHAGEGGLFGRQDIDVSEPTIAKAVADGLDVASRGTRCSSSCAPASTMRWSRCTTTRGTSR